MHKVIEDLNWRYATKKFDPTKKISTEELEIIKESLRLVPTSYGLQSLKFLIIENPELRERLVDASYGQRQVAEASHLLVMCAYKDVNEQHVNDYVQNICATRGLDADAMEGYGDFMKKTIAKLSSDKMKVWNSKQLYIALGQLMSTCATLKIDSTPMEGFDANQYDEILDLKDSNLMSVLACPIGYRHADDAAQHKAKVRKPIEELFEII